MDTTLISTLSGSALSLAFSYLPGLQDWYQTLDSKGRAWVMLGVMVLVSVGLFVASCSGQYVTVACTQDGAIELAKFFFAALVANQSTFAITKKL